MLLFYLFMSHFVPEGTQNSFLSNKYEIEYNLGKYEMEFACSSYYASSDGT